MVTKVCIVDFILWVKQSMKKVAWLLASKDDGSTFLPNVRTYSTNDTA